MKSLQDEFDNNEPEHFTYYDYFCQLCDNGQYSAIKGLLKELDNKSLLTLHREWSRLTVVAYIESELLTRMK